MDKYSFNDRPDAARIAMSTSAAQSNIDPTVVLKFLDFQWAYRRMQREYDHVLAVNNLSESRFIILMFLSQAPHHQLLPSAIAAKLGSTRVTVTKMIKGLTEMHWVEKHPSTEDKRATLIHLTTLGQATLLDYLPRNFAAIQTLFGQLTAAELTTLDQLLSKINQGTVALKKEMEF